MTTEEVEAGFIELLKRLSGYWQLIRRSMSNSIPLTMFLLYMNYLFRKEYLVLRKKRRALHTTSMPAERARARLAASNTQKGDSVA